MDDLARGGWGDLSANRGHRSHVVRAEDSGSQQNGEDRGVGLVGLDSVQSRAKEKWAAWAAHR
jgi:hypothetical protein